MESNKKKCLRSSKNVNATKVNPYENDRMMRVAENNERLEELGLPGLVTSFNRLGKKPKTKKRKQKQVDNAENDVEYMPDSSFEDNDDQVHREDARRKKVTKKKENARFIAPMKLTREANLSKKRVVADPNLSPLLNEKTQKKKGQAGENTRPKKSRVQQSEKGSKSNSQQLDTIHKKANNGLKNSEANEDYEDLDVTNPFDEDATDNQFDKIDATDDQFDEMEGTEDQFEEMDATENHSDKENSVEYDRYSADDMEGNYNDDETQLNHTENETEVNDTHEVFQDEADTNENVHDELEAPHSDNDSDVRVTKNKRGPTRMRKVWGQRRKSDRIPIVVNDKGQPISKSTSQLTHFMGTISRSGTYFPLHVPWNKVTNEDKAVLLAFLRTRFIIPKAADEWILKSFGRKVKNWRGRLKTKFFDESLSTRRQLRFRPKNVEKSEWKRLINYWKTEKTKMVSEKNKENRAKKKMTQFTGKKSYAMIREELKAKEGRSPTRMEMFKKCFYKEGTSTNAEVETAIEQMENLNSTLPDGSIDKPGPDDIYSKVRGNNKYGAADMYGLGVRASDVWGKLPSRAAVRIENEILKSEKAEHINEIETLKTELAKKNGSVSTMTTTQCSVVPKVGDEVFLHNIVKPSEKVGRGWLRSLNPTELIGGVEIGEEWCAVDLQVVMKNGHSLIRPFDLFWKLDDAIGARIAWPCSFTSVVDED